MRDIFETVAASAKEWTMHPLAHARSYIMTGADWRFGEPLLKSALLPYPMNRKASAVWRGDLKSGRGTISTESTVLKDAQYSFGTRFENGAGTNPEELIGAAHAGCFSMALSAELQKAGFTAESISTTA